MPERKSGLGLSILSRIRLDRLVLKTMPVSSPKAQISGGKAAFSSQRVEDNAFHLKLPPNKSCRLFTPRLDGGNFGEIGREIVRGKILNVHFDQAHKRTAKIRFR